MSFDIKFSNEDLRSTYGRTLVELGEEYSNVVVLDADLCTSTMTSLFRDQFPKRFIQCGIAEANMFGIAAGMAERGFVVFPSTFAAFAVRKAADPIYLQICGHNANVKIPGSYPGLTATECGMSHNCCEDIGFFSSLPNMKVAAPGDDNELHSFMKTIVKEEGPVYFRIPKIKAPVLFDESYNFEWGKSYQLTSGSDAALFTTGMMTGIALAASFLLEKDGIHITVIHMPSIKPLDTETIDACAAKCGKMFTIENARIDSNFGCVIANYAASRAYGPVTQLGIGKETFAQSDNLYSLLVYNKLTPGDVALSIKKGLEKE